MPSFARCHPPAIALTRSVARLLAPAALLVWSGAARAQEPPPDGGSVPRGGAGAVVVPAPTAPAPADPGKITMPRLKKYAAPVYPPKAAEAGTEGAVVLELDIDAAGRVTKAAVKTPGGHGFDEAALAAAPNLEFEPARRADGTPFAARILYQYRFTLEPREKAASAAAPRPDVETIAGRVLAAGTDAPLAGAPVTLRGPDGATRTTTTDASGNFRFLNLPPGKYHVEVAAPGFDPFQADEDIAANETIQVKYRLTIPASAPKGEDDVIDVTVRGERRPREVTRRTLERAEIERIPGTFGDALRSITNLPGVARTPFGSGLLIVRGSAPQDSLTFIDRAPVPIIYHFGGLSSVVPTEMLEKIDFYPGNFSAEYGRAMGGIVDVALRSPKQDGKYHGLAQLDFIDGRLMFEGPVPFLKGWTFAIAGRRSWIDALLGPALSQAGGGLVQAPVYYDYQFLLENRPSARERFRIAFYGSDDAFKVLIDEPPENEPVLTGDFGFHTAFQRLQLSYENRWSDRDRIAWTTALGRDVVDFQAGPFFLTNESLSINVRLEASRRFAKWLTANVGADISGSLANVTVRFPDVQGQGGPPSGAVSTLPPFTQTYHGVFTRPAAYAELEIVPVPRLRLVPGVRFDFAVDTGEVDVSPRLNARYSLAPEFPRTTAKAGVGVYHQPPQFQESVVPFGVRGLSSNRAVHYALGIEQDITRRLEISVEGFVKQLDRLVVSTPGGGYANEGTGYAAGGEVLLKYKPDDLFFGWLAYTLSRSARTDHPGEEEHLASFDQTHILTVLGSFKLPRGIELGARFRLASGNLQTPYLCNPSEPGCNPGRVNAVYDATSNTFTPIPYGNRYTERLPLFHQLDLRADKVWRFKHWRFSMYLDVQNVYNNQAVEGLGYNFNYTQRRNITGLPLLPSFGLRGDF